MEGIVKKSFKHFLRRFGYDIFSTEYLREFVFALQIRDLFKALDIQCVLDVGANEGGYYNFLRNEVEYQGLIVSFEPVKHNVEILREKSKSDSNWIIYDIALGADDTTMDINVMKYNVFSSFLSPDHSNVGDFKETNKIDHTETVKVKKLDGVLPQIKEEMGVDNFFLKMDTQGFDLQVVDGATQSLAQIPLLQTEVSIKSIYKDMPDFDQVYRVLSEKGFDIAGMYTVTRDKLRRVVEFDCVMINTYHNAVKNLAGPK
jgi:FkbM family methyltransferase